mgnify:CR=1 FL=1
MPERFVFRFDRRLSVGESPEAAVEQIEHLGAVAAVRAAGLTVDVSVPRYRCPTWTGHAVDDPQVYPGWVTPDDHPAIRAAVETYRRVVSPYMARSEPRVDTWVFSTDGVGFVTSLHDEQFEVPAAKRWVVSGSTRHPAMFGIGAGIEQNTHRIGECVDERELQHAIAMLARFPSLFTGE